MTAPWDSQIGVWLWDLDILDWRKVTLADFKELTEPGGNYIKMMAYDVSGNLEYLGVALPGVSTASIGWKIAKMSYSSGNMTSYLFANGDSSFNYIWDNRATYSYS